MPTTATPATGIEGLMKQRKKVKRKLTDSIKTFKVLIDQTEDAENIRWSFQKVRKVYDDLIQIQDQIADLELDNDSDADLKDIENYKDQLTATFLECSKLLDDTLKKVNEKEKTSQDQSNVKVVEDANSDVVKILQKLTDQEIKAAPVKLEGLKLPVWNGEDKDFYSWKRVFLSVMCEAKETTDQAIISRMLTTIPEVWKSKIALCKSMNEVWKEFSYTITPEIVQEQVYIDFKRLRHLNTDPESKDIRDFIGGVRMFIRRMTDLEKDKETETDACLSDVKYKIGPSLNLNYSNFMALKKEAHSLTSLLEYLEREATVRASCAKPKAREKEKDKGRKGVNGRVNSYGRVDDNEGRFSGNSGNKKYPCGYCEKDHDINNCGNFASKSVEDRRKFIMETRRCFNCLRKGHRSYLCRSEKKCDKCCQHHHTLLHLDGMNPKAAEFKPQPETASGTGVYHCVSGIESSTFMPVVKIEVLDMRGRPQTATALLDSGSDTSLVRRGLLKKLGLENSGEETELSYVHAGGGIRTEKSSYVPMRIASADLSSGLFEIMVYAVNKPCHSSKKISAELFDNHPYLKPVKDKVYRLGGNIDLLLGNDQAYLLRDLESLCDETRPEENPVAVRSLLGWYIVGGCNNKASKAQISAAQVLSVNSVTKIRNSEEDIKNMFENDILGIQATRLCVCSESELSESAFIQHVTENTKRVDDRLEVKIPWKEGYPEALPNNLPKAIKQMKHRERELKRDSNLKLYSEQIDDLVKRGVVKMLSWSEITAEEAAWYLNHRAVLRPDKSTAIRVVFDSASEYKGHSLNKAMEKGPNYLNDLFKCLTIWREFEIAVTGDISKMFNQILLYVRDQAYHRFLWRHGIEENDPTVYQWIRVPFGDKSSPDLAGYCVKLLAHEKKMKFPEASEILKKNLYVDDISFSNSSIEVAKQNINAIEEILLEGSFPIKKWNSNNRLIDPDQDEIVDVLGLRWNKKEDIFKLKAREIDELKIVTKRNLLRLVAKFWDPVGMLSPCLIKYRMALQAVWATGIDWDTPLEPEYAEKWQQYRLEMIKLFEDQGQKRCLKPENCNVQGKPQLHGFSDGGEKGYGGVVFLRWETDDGIKVIFVAARSLVAPLKKRSIPRIELMACTVLSRLVKSIEDALKTELVKKILWMDSTTVKVWVESPAREYKAFVGAKVAEIQETHPNGEFRYIESALNPADQLTKPIEFESLPTWREGPPFLRLPEEQWPTYEKENIPTPNIEIERKPKEKSVKTKKLKDPLVPQYKVNAVRKKDTLDHNAEDGILNTLQLCKTWNEALEKIAARNRVFTAIKKEDANVGPYTVKELENARIHIFKLCQMGTDFKDKRYDKLNPCYDENTKLYKAGSRIKGQYLPTEIKHPVIIPKDTIISRLLVSYYHEKCGHAGYRRIKAEIQSYGIWLCGAKNLILSVAARCMFCRIRRRPLKDQMMGELPDFRTQPNTTPFQNCALDYFGPLKVRYGGRSITEGYVCIMTCMVTRAIHLELATDASTEKFLLAWRRFSCLRGVNCKTVWSDNGRNFVGAESKIREIISEWNEDRIKRELAKKGTDFDWKFNVPYGSHMNGVVESLIRSVRKALDGTSGLYDTVYTAEEWCTYLAEVTYMVNSRPLFPEGEDPVDSPSITPNSLLHGHGIEIPQPITPEKVNPRDRMRFIQQKAQIFWCIWMKYMPPQLIERNKWYHPRDNLKIGDLVLLLKPGLKGSYAPRATWEKATVIETYPGQDGLVRKVRVKSAKGEYDRPVAKMCLIATNGELKHGMKD